MDRLRVLTLNIWNVMGDWRARRKDIIAWIDHLEPHVVCLQEVIESPDGKNQADWIAEAARAGGVGHVVHVPDTDSAVVALKEFGVPGDVVLVKGSRSAKMERIVQALEKEGKN